MGSKKRANKGLLKRKKSPNSPKNKDKYKQNGLSKPSKVSWGSPEFAKLQEKWYKKLSDEGFEDLEWVDNKTGFGQNSDLFKDGSSGNAVGKRYSPQTAYFFSIMQNYVTHNEEFLINLFKDERRMYAIKGYLEGVPYRKLAREYNAKLRKRDNKKLYTFMICRTVQLVNKLALEWNASGHPEALIPEGSHSLDCFIEDIELSGETRKAD